MFFKWFGDSQIKDPSEFDRVFKFVRACEYGLPEYYTLVETIVNAMSGPEADYSLFVAGVRNVFRPECVKVLDDLFLLGFLSVSSFFDGSIWIDNGDMFQGSSEITTDCCYVIFSQLRLFCLLIFC
jgi:hypothetical protein